MIAPNSVVCDSAGSCILKSDLHKKDNLDIGLNIPGLGGFNISTADRKNSVVCDSDGNCIINDKLAKKDNWSVGLDTPIGGFNIGSLLKTTVVTVKCKHAFMMGDSTFYFADCDREETSTTTAAPACESVVVAGKTYYTGDCDA